MKVLGTGKVERYEEIEPMFGKIYDHTMAKAIEPTGPAIFKVEKNHLSRSRA